MKQARFTSFLIYSSANVIGTKSSKYTYGRVINIQLSIWDHILTNISLYIIHQLIEWTHTNTKWCLYAVAQYVSLVYIKYSDYANDIFTRFISLCVWIARSWWRHLIERSSVWVYPTWTRSNRNLVYMSHLTIGLFHYAESKWDIFRLQSDAILAFSIFWYSFKTF